MFIALALSAAFAPAPAATLHHVRRLSDADLVRFAASPFDARKMMFSHQLVGIHRGIRVVADYPCGDVCPHYTRRIIRYDVALADCARVGGIIRSEKIVRGIGVATIDVCKPAVLARTSSAG
jgi:hypothetical protein